MFGLKGLEPVWLFGAVAITAHQMIARDGAFDPIAFALITFLIALIPGGRVESKKKKGEGGEDEDEPPQSPASKGTSAVKKALRKALEDPEEGS